MNATQQRQFRAALEPAAAERLASSDDPIAWLAAAANCYARRQNTAAKRKETRTYADRKAYQDGWRAKRAASNSDTK